MHPFLPVHTKYYCTCLLHLQLYYWPCFFLFTLFLFPVTSSSVFSSFRLSELKTTAGCLTESFINNSPNAFAGAAHTSSKWLLSGQGQKKVYKDTFPASDFYSMYTVQIFNNISVQLHPHSQLLMLKCLVIIRTVCPLHFLASCLSLALSASDLQLF